MPPKITPYVLPLASILVISLLFIFAKPSITGFAVRQNPVLNAEIRITAEEILPENAIIYIYLEDAENNTLLEIEKTKMKDFVQRYNISLAHTEGSNIGLDFQGLGYIGNAVFNLKGINIEEIKPGTYFLKTEISWSEKIISETKQEIKV